MNAEPLRAARVRAATGASGRRSGNREPRGTQEAAETSERVGSGASASCSGRFRLRLSALGGGWDGKRSVYRQVSEEESRFDVNLFYDAGDQGCTEGPLEQIAQLARRLSGGQTLEVRATNPSVAHDLPAWCRLASYELLQQDGDRYVIGRPRKEV